MNGSKRTCHRGMRLLGLALVLAAIGAPGAQAGGSGLNAPSARADTGFVLVHGRRDGHQPQRHIPPPQADLGIWEAGTISPIAGSSEISGGTQARPVPPPQADLGTWDGSLSVGGADGPSSAAHPEGFDWAVAVIGAGAAGMLVVLAMGLALVTRRSRKASVPLA